MFAGSCSPRTVVSRLASSEQSMFSAFGEASQRIYLGDAGFTSELQICLGYELAGSQGYKPFEVFSDFCMV